MDANLLYEDLPLTLFQHATEQELRYIIMKPPNKSCELDPIPTSLLEKSIEPFRPLINSIDQKIYPSLFKEVFLRPLLKQSVLEKLSPSIQSIFYFQGSKQRCG